MLSASRESYKTYSAIGRNVFEAILGKKDSRLCLGRRYQPGHITQVCAHLLKLPTDFPSSLWFPALRRGGCEINFSEGDSFQRFPEALECVPSV